MKISNRGLELIKKDEAFASKPYLCPANKPTIGFGMTFYPNRQKVTLKDKAISIEEANNLLIELIEKHFDINPLVKVPLTQNQFDALTSFAYNIGMPNFTSSTLLRQLNRNNFESVLYEFGRWNKSNGKVLNGLTRRRERERALFNAK